MVFLDFFVLDYVHSSASVYVLLNDYRYCCYDAYFHAFYCAAITPTTPVVTPAAAAAALGKLRRYRCGKRTSTIFYDHNSFVLVFGLLFLLLWRGVVLIFDVQFPEYFEHHNLNVN